MSVSEKNKQTNELYLSLGANIDPLVNLEKACSVLSELTNLLAISSFWSGPPIGVDGANFVNSAVHLNTPLSMHNFKRDVVRKIENDLGRVRDDNKFSPRPIDLDILIFNNLEIDIDIWRYAYLAAPLAEIYPEYKNSRTGEILGDIAKRLKTQSKIYIVKSSG